MTLDLLQVPLPMRFRPRRAMSDRRLQRLCEVNDVLIIERDSKGWIHIKPIAGCQVSLMSMAIGVELERWNKKVGRGITFSNAGFTLPDTSMLGSQLSWILTARWESLSHRERRSFAPCNPDFVVEFLSPYDRLADMRAKMKLWLANGVQLAWLVVPDAKTVEVFQQGEPVQILKKPGSLRGAGPLTTFDMSTERLWREAK